MRLGTPDMRRRNRRVAAVQNIAQAGRGRGSLQGRRNWPHSPKIYPSWMGTEQPQKCIIPRITSTLTSGQMYWLATVESEV